ncbi:MAG: FeoB-associated Cys-rich membrane protein, partial [Candidatus Fermentibacteraceae bacterium]|nr:FeoB-associated Cys-rich membrane protein [Candidatus Fermentibacteraceae bacterium]
VPGWIAGDIMETAAVVVIVAAVVLYLVRRAVHSHRSGDICSSCSASCPYSAQCGSSLKLKKENLQTDV